MNILSLEEYNKLFSTQKKTQLTNTVEENLQYLSSYQQQRAKKARKVFKALGTPTTKDLKAIIRMNLIKNSKIILEDVDLTEKIFGPNIGLLKSKTTRK